jgi:transposase
VSTKQRQNQLVKQIEELVPSWSLQSLVNALCLMKGINVVAAATILSVTGDLRRFPTPIKLSAYFGLVPSEHSSGDRVKRFRITKAGNSEARRVLIQAAWSYHYPARVTRDKELIQAAWSYHYPARVTRDKELKLSKADNRLRNIAWRAQLRLCKRYRHLLALGKRAPVACTAVARALATFIWEMGQIVPLTS